MTNRKNQPTFQACLATIHLVKNWYATRIYVEKTKKVPDPELVEHLEAGYQTCVDDLRAVEPDQAEPLMEHYDRLHHELVTKVRAY